MRYGSVCSGIEAATAAWHHMGWKPAFFSEIEKFPRAVLEHRYPDVPLHGDFTTIEENQYGKIDILVGGTPCQSFSVAGLRGGLDDDRGNLALEFCRLADRERPRWIVWENVPGVLSSSGGRDFGSILGALAEIGYGLAYRVLDAQYFGVAQRRRRVFVVGYLGDWRCAAAVLFERHSLQGHPAPSREKRKDAAGGAAPSTPERGGRSRGGGSAGGDAPRTPERDGRRGGGSAVGTMPAHTLRGEGFDVSEDGTGRGTPIVPVQHPIAIQERAVCENPDAGPDGKGWRDDGAAYTLEARSTSQAIAFSSKDYGADATEDCSPTLRAGGHNDSHANAGVPPAVVYPINTQLGLRGPDTSNTSREGLGLGNEDDPAYTLQAGHSHAVAYDILGTPATEVAKKTDVHTPLRSRTPGQFENSTTTMIVGATEAVVYPINMQSAAKNGEKSPNGLGIGAENDPSPTLGANDKHAVAYDLRGCEGGSQLEGPHDTANIRAASGGSSKSYVMQSAVRRLTPVECERLQGFPDNFTAIPWGKKAAEDCPDGPRYKALGNSMAVPVMRWIGERIQLVDDLVSVL